jgi:cysteine synthase A
LARSLFLYALCNGWLRPGAPVIEVSSGSTAVSEVYFARLLGLLFIAVMPASISPEKIAQIAFYGGQSHLLDAPQGLHGQAQQLAATCGGHFMDQFTYAERPLIGALITILPSRFASRCGMNSICSRRG